MALLLYYIFPLLFYILCATILLYYVNLNTFLSFPFFPWYKFVDLSPKKKASFFVNPVSLLAKDWIIICKITVLKPLNTFVNVKLLVFLFVVKKKSCIYSVKSNEVYELWFSYNFSILKNYT